ncbi:ATP-binding cassette domain-containing protein [Paenibacillus yanchengensis]|uniref:ATP-binding cassette domain-containing protein n=1 Tax=Paenibacillus yanchengensis TaxID=2035833 RepID=A0ABW4YPH7_9BACL
MGITFQNISFRFNKKRADAALALDDITFTLPAHQFITLLGAPGSGKSTMLQHMNGLLRADRGSIQIFDMAIPAQKGKLPQQLRQRVGLVFQYPEQQLFRETVIDDILFGPLNFFADRTEAEQAATDASQAMGISETLLQQNPFQLSSGQMRKVAIAATIATKPDVMVLDEPTASLDPQSRLELLQLLQVQSVEHKRTIVVVTHNLEEVFPFTDYFIVMDAGKVVFSGSPAALLQQSEILRNAGLQLPAGHSLFTELMQWLPVDSYLTPEQKVSPSPAELAMAIKAALEANSNSTGTSDVILEDECRSMSTLDVVQEDECRSMSTSDVVQEDECRSMSTLDVLDVAQGADDNEQ